MTESKSAYGNCIKDFKFGDKIGKGGFGEVFKAKCITPGFKKLNLDVAIKKISKKRVNERGCKHRIKNEIEIHSHLPPNPFFVQFYTWFEDDSYWYLVLELCTEGSLEDYIKRHNRLSEEKAVTLIKQVINGVRCLQHDLIIHRDLSLRNLLLTKDHQVKIADFGFAVKLNHIDEKKNTVLGTANFTPPEVFNHDSYDFNYDWWSVGCVLYALLYGSPPFDGKTREEIMKNVKHSQLEFPNYASREAKELLKAMLHKNEKKRIRIQDILKHDFFQKYEKSVKINEINCQKNSGDSGMSSFSSSGLKKSQSTHNSSDEYDLEPNYHKSRKERKSTYVKSAPVTRSYDHIISQKQRSEHALYQDSYVENYIDDPLKDNSCSHDQYCAPGNRCFHKQSCCCHQIRSDSCPSLVNCTKENKNCMDVRCTVVEKSLKDIIDPLNTERLSCRRIQIKLKEKKKYVMFSILSDGQVCLEYWKKAKSQKKVYFVYYISDNGLEITVYEPKEKILLNPDQPPPVPHTGHEVQYFTFENLPEKYWKKYRVAKLFVDKVKGRTPKITIYEDHVKCVMMENSPNPNFEMDYYNGFQIIKDENKITIKDKNGCIITKKDDDINFMLKEFETMKDRCIMLEKYTEACPYAKFPVIFGKKPDVSKRIVMQDSNKENVSATHSQSPSLSGLNSGVKHCNITIGTENSLFQNTFQSTSTPYSSQTSANSSKITAKNLPHLKSLEVVNEWVIADYKDCSQLRISMSDGRMFFKEAKTQTLFSSTEYPHLTQFVNDSRDIIRCALLKERERKT